MLERPKLATYSTPAAIQRKPATLTIDGCTNLHTYDRVCGPMSLQKRLTRRHTVSDESDSQTSTQQLKNCSRTASHVAFLPAQMSDIQEIVSSSRNEALRIFDNHEAQARFPNELRTLSPRTLNTATSLGCIVLWKKASRTKCMFVTARLHVSLPGSRSAVALRGLVP